MKHYYVSKTLCLAKETRHKLLISSLSSSTGGKQIVYGEKNNKTDYQKKGGKGE